MWIITQGEYDDIRNIGEFDFEPADVIRSASDVAV